MFVVASSPSIATDYYKRSLAIRERVSVNLNTDQEIANVLAKLGMCLQANHLDEGMSYLRRSMAIRKLDS